MFRIRVGKKLNLKNPKSFNEKLQWLKLYDRNDIYTTMVDKYAAKSYVEKIIGNQYIIPNNQSGILLPMPTSIPSAIM